MSSKNNEEFKMYTDQETKNLRQNLSKLLDNIQALCNKFLLNYDKFPKLQKEIKNLILTHQIYKNRKKLHTFDMLVMNCEKDVTEKVSEIQKESEMKKKRKEELDAIANIIATGNKMRLSDGSEKYKNIKQLPAPEEKVEKKNIDIEEKNENIICDFSKKEESKKEDEDDILVEDSKDVEKNYLNKKRKLLNEKTVQNQKKNSINFKRCYICKTPFNGENIHKFYGNICTKCGDYNYSFRVMKLDFTGRIAIVTGGRVKIGYYIATKLLSYNCKVLITSRFPKDTLLKYKKDPNYENWKNNLIIYPIDFRIFESTIKFIDFINQNFPHVDILINNAAQTIRRTTNYYKYLLPIETKKLNPEDQKKIINSDYISLKKQLEDSKNIKKSDIKNALIPLINDKNAQEILPLSVIASQIKIMEENSQHKISGMGGDGQALDFNTGKNSWNLEFDEIPFQEFTEVQIINAWTPYYLSIKLKPLMMKSPFQDKYIVNVTSVEGIFNHYKRTTHVHTNMAKAALNMFTRTCGFYLKKLNIYMTCVDTGWVSPMNEMSSLLNENKKESYENEFVNIPLDELDGAMRILHPIIEGIKNKNYLSGILLKDYIKADW